jgi:hypothetical protein
VSGTVLGTKDTKVKKAKPLTCVVYLQRGREKGLIENTQLKLHVRTRGVAQVTE